jgi:peptide/nickel transport system substrate-binding protein
MGTGPYKFEEWRAGDKHRPGSYNPDFFEGRPYLNGYVYVIKPDLATMFLELKAGNIDRMGLTPLAVSSARPRTPSLPELFNKYKYVSHFPTRTWDTTWKTRASRTGGCARP